MPAETPATPAPIIAMSSTSACEVSRFWKSGSFRIARTAFVAVSDENFSRGIPERSPAIRTPGRLVIPFSPVTGNFSTAPAGQRVCSHWVYAAMGLFMVSLQHHVRLANSSRAAVWMHPFECPAPKRFRISQKKWIGWERLAQASFGKARALNTEYYYTRFGRQHAMSMMAAGNL